MLRKPICPLIAGLLIGSFACQPGYAVTAVNLGGGTTLTDSASLRTALSDENGTGAALFSGATNPTLAGSTLTGHLLFTDATYDIGASGATRPRNIYTSGDLYLGGADAIMGRDAANVVAHRNSTNAQVLRIYNTDNGSNDEYVDLGWADASNYFSIQTAKTGSGTARGLILKGTSNDILMRTNNIYFQSDSNVTHWLKNTSGHLVTGTDNAYDIGASGATRPRNVYVANDTVVSGSVCLSASTELTIATGAVAATKSHHTIDTEGDAASDDLDTISGGTAGDVLIIRAENGARTVVAKDGTGNLKLSGDITLDNAEDTLMLISDGTNWYMISSSNNGT